MKFFKKIKFKDLESPKNLKKILTKYKVVLVKNFFDGEMFCEKVSEYLTSVGLILDDKDEDLNTGEQKNNQFIDITYDPNFENLYRSSSNSQPLHTDFSYIEIEKNIQFLMCLSSAPFGGATKFIDSKDLVSLMMFDNKNDLIYKLKTTDVGFQKCEKRYKISKILRESNNDFLFNYNYQPFLRYNNEKFVCEMVEEFKNFLETKIEKSGLVKEVLLQKNDVVFFHDSLVLHGRNSYFAKTKGDRKLIKGTIII